MQIVFKDPTFSYNLLRTVGHAVYGGADIGECFSTAYRIQDGDFESWYQEWVKTGDRLRELADKSFKQGHAVSARQAYLRASNYYRNAELFLQSNPADPRLLATWNNSRECFSKAASLFSPTVEAIAIPYENTILPGYFYRVDNSGEPRPTLLVFPGMDSTLEELYFFIVAAALQRGYNCIAFEGPGQGGVIRQQKLPFRPDWEQVIAPVVDYALTRLEVDPQWIILVGQSFGGYLAPRAAAYEPRLAACISHGGYFNLYECMIEILPEPLRAQLGSPAFDGSMQAIMNANAGFRLTVAKAMWTLGASSPSDLAHKTLAYTLKGVAEKITCPTLVIDAEAEHFFPKQPRKVYDALTCPKTYLCFTVEEGAEEHCQVGALTLFHECLFAWIQQTLNCPV